MKIELASIKHMPSLSDETECFTAIVLVDGVRAFSAENRGCGGATDIHGLPSYTGPCVHDVSLWLTNNRPRVDLGDGLDCDHDLEWEIGELLEKHIAGKRFRVEVEAIDPDAPPRADPNDMRPQWLATLHYNGQREGARRVVVATYRGDNPYEALREVQMEAVRRDGRSICITGMSCVEIPRGG